MEIKLFFMLNILISVFSAESLNFLDFCPGIAKTINCKKFNEFILLTDAFYGTNGIPNKTCNFM